MAGSPLPVKKLKVAILLCGLLGLAELVIPFRGASMLRFWFAVEPAQSIVITAAFVLPIFMAAVALARPPIQGWQAGVSLASFLMAAVKFRVWDLLGNLSLAGLHGCLLIGAIVVGAILSLVALIRPEA